MPSALKPLQIFSLPPGSVYYVENSLPDDHTQTARYYGGSATRHGARIKTARVDGFDSNHNPVYLTRITVTRPAMVVHKIGRKGGNANES